MTVKDLITQLLDYPMDDIVANVTGISETFFGQPKHTVWFNTTQPDGYDLKRFEEEYKENHSNE